MEAGQALTSKSDTLIHKYVTKSENCKTWHKVPVALLPPNKEIILNILKRQKGTIKLVTLATMMNNIAVCKNIGRDLISNFLSCD